MGNTEDNRMVFEYDSGQWTFRRFNPGANDAQLLDLAEALNEFQPEDVKRVLIVTTRKY